MLRIKESEFIEWKESAATQYFFEFLEREANSHRQMMGMGGCKGDSVLETGQCYMESDIRAQLYEQITKMEYEDTLEDSDENFTNRAPDINIT